MSSSLCQCRRRQYRHVWQNMNHVTSHSFCCFSWRSDMAAKKEELKNEAQKQTNNKRKQKTNNPQTNNNNNNKNPTNQPTTQPTTTKRYFFCINIGRATKMKHPYTILCTFSTFSAQLESSLQFSLKWSETVSIFRAQELCESRGGRPGLPVPESP